MRRGAAGACLLVVAAAAQAQALRDPTQPAWPVPGATTGSPAAEAPDGLVLQSVVLSQGRRLATISGKVYRLGDRVGAARLVEISPEEVSLREAGKTRVLRLLPASAVKRPGGDAVPPTRSGPRPLSGDKG